LTGVGVAGVSSASTSGNAIAINSNNQVVLGALPYFRGGHKTNTDIGDHIYSDNRGITNSGGRLYAPVTGVYLFSVSSITDSTSSVYDMRVYRNGSQHITSARDQSSHYNSHNDRIETFVIGLNAGDYINVENDQWYDSGHVSTWKTVSMALLG